MLITLKNKDTLKIDDFNLKCSIGKRGIVSIKREGDKCTPRGIFTLGKLYYRADRVKKPNTILSSKIIFKHFSFWLIFFTSSIKKIFLILGLYSRDLDRLT